MYENGFWKVPILTWLAAVVLVAVFSLAGCGEKEEETGPVTLTYATFYLDFEMEQWIGEWNQSQDKYRVEILEYENDDTGHARLNNEIVSGKVPDLLDLSYINIGSYISKGILADLYPFLDGEKAGRGSLADEKGSAGKESSADGESLAGKEGSADEESRLSREDLVPGVYQTYEENGKLYGIMPCFRLETLAGKKTLVGEASDWTLEEMRNRMENLSPGQLLLDGLAPFGLLRAVVEADMGAFVDWEAGTCSFDGEEFRKLLESAAAMKVESLEEEQLEEGLVQGKILLNRIYITDVLEYHREVERFGGDPVSLLGFPTRSGGRAALTARMPIGICELSERKEGAWEFVRSLLEEEFQRKHVHFCLPINLKCLLESFQTAMGENPYGEESGVDWKPASQEEMDALYEGICQAKYSSIFDGEIWKIISEEAPSYFDGDKSVEEVMDTIQSRVALYVSENY